MESAQGYSERIRPVFEELMIRLQALERENNRLKIIQKQTIEKDKIYQHIQDNSRKDFETELRAEKWMIVEKIMKEHPESNVRKSYETYVDVANKWYDKQLEHEKLYHSK